MKTPSSLLYSISITSTVLLCIGLGNTAVQAATFTVTNLNDSGAGSLRQAIADANGNNNPDQTDIVTFAPSVTGTINLRTFGDSSNGNNAFALTEQISIEGPGANLLSVRRDTGGYYRHFRIADGITASISGLTLSNGEFYKGGAIFVEDNANLTLANSILTRNASDDGGAIFSSHSTLLIEGCLFAGNTANLSGGALDSSGYTQVRNATLVDNSTSFSGGAVYNRAGMTLLDSCTIVGNRAKSGWGGIVADYKLALTRVVNSIIVGNAGGDAYTEADVSLGNNIVGIVNGAGPFYKTGDQRGQTLVGTGLDTVNGIPRLADNGGPTQTIALLPDSPAINAGHTHLVTDQRGVSRADHPDIGAYEFSIPPSSLSLQ